MQDQSFRVQSRPCAALDRRPPPKQRLRGRHWAAVFRHPVSVPILASAPVGLRQAFHPRVDPVALVHSAFDRGRQRGGCGGRGCSGGLAFELFAPARTFGSFVLVLATSSAAAGVALSGLWNDMMEGQGRACLVLVVFLFGCIVVAVIASEKGVCCCYCCKTQLISK